MSKESHSFSVSVANEVGVISAIILQHLTFLQQELTPAGEDWTETWITRSRAALSKTYSYLSEKEVRGATERLESAGIIESFISNQDRFDRKKSYRLTEKGLDLMGFDTLAKRANAFAQKGERLAKRANANRGNYNSYNNNSVAIATESASDEQKDASKPVDRGEAIGYDFETFWNDYGFKHGSKKNARAKWAKLKTCEIEMIRATLEMYKRDTVTTDADRGRANFKPMRKHPEFWLNSKGWEVYAELKTEHHATDAPTEYDEFYKEYVNWVASKHPDLIKSVAYLSKTQYISAKTRDYNRGAAAIGDESERFLLKHAHESYLPAKGGDVFAHYCNLINERLKSRQA